MKLGLRVVPDTNVFIAAYKSASPGSPNKKFIDRWQKAEFDLLFSEDTLLEYIEKLRELGVGQQIVNKLIRAIIALGIQVEIIYFHLRHYPEDSDDTAFLLCAVNGDATHIVSQDQHLLRLNHLYPFTICKISDFLVDLQQINSQL